MIVPYRYISGEDAYMAGAYRRRGDLFVADTSLNLPATRCRQIEPGNWKVVDGTLFVDVDKTIEHDNVANPNTPETGTETQSAQAGGLSLKIRR
jgi:hypothetical protein